MRQLGHWDLEDDPGRHNPGEAVSNRGFVAVGPHPRQGQQHDERGRPEPDPEKQCVKTGWHSARGFPIEDLAEQVLADRFLEERAPRSKRDRQQPGRDHCRAERRPGQRPEFHEPAHVELERGERGDGSQHDQEYDWALDENAEPDRTPAKEKGWQREWWRLGPPQVSQSQQALGGEHACEQRGVGGGDAGLEIQQHG